MTKKLLYFIFCAVFVFCVTSLVYAGEYNAVVLNLGDVSQDYKNLLLAISKETGDTFKIGIYPPARCIFMIENKKADILVPIIAIPDKNKVKNLKFDYSTVDIIDLPIVLYSNKNKNIDINELKKGNTGNFKIETDIGHIDHFPFKVSGSNDIAQSLKKVDAERIDGYILGQTAVDAVLKELKLQNIKKQPYDIFKIKFVLQKGQKGGELDNKILEAINKLKESGQIRKIMPHEFQ